MRKVSDTLSVDQKDGIAVISITENLGYDTAADLRATYNGLSEDYILVDLGGVTLTSSRGMATLLSIILESEDKGQQVHLCNVSSPCMNIIDAMDIVTHVPGLKIFGSLEEGIEQVGSTQ